MVKNKDHWNEVVKENKHHSTQPDFNLREAEIELLKTYLNSSDIVLDIGCGTAFSTSVFAENVLKIIGIDYAENMIKVAKEEYSHIKNCDFKTVNTLDKKFSTDNSNAFDKIISTRCLINLKDFSEQTQAITNIHKMLSNNGVYLMLEGWDEGRDNLNILRKENNLPIIEKKWFNHTFNSKELYPLIEKYFVLEEEKHFDFYYLISRIIHPMYVTPEAPSFNHTLNIIAKTLNKNHYEKILNGISLNKLLVLRKKSL